jgi:phosphoribosylaminoimidazolecarboxamide formyltransferase/IMP cyclohydrolase
MQDRIKRALVSVYDKQGVVEFCRELQSMDVEILSSGGTARTLVEGGVRVTPVEEYTGFPELLGGRVKTLHPRIHAGILAVRGNAAHQEDLRRAEIDPIDLVVVNLYPFEQTAADRQASEADVVEMIDVGGPTMVRAAAKNFDDVGVIVSPGDYAAVLGELRESGNLSPATRRRLAVSAFHHTARYDDAIYRYLQQEAPAATAEDEEAPLPDRLRIDLTRRQGLRYGENPHQRAAFYVESKVTGPCIAQAEQLQGKELSFNNILDFDAALGLVVEFPDSACAVIKHGNPCGVALGESPRLAFERALECDPLSAFGGVIAFNRAVDGQAAERVAKQFYEGVIAPAFDDEARKLLARKKKLRLLELGEIGETRRGGFDLRRVNGGLLAQDWDVLTEEVRRSRVVTDRQPSDEEWQGLAFAWTVVKHVKSNAIVYAFADRAVGIGAGQMSRVDSSRFAIQKARVPLKGAVMASDAFFPFRDGIDLPAEAGVTAVVQPGGSIRDDEVIGAANEHGMAMVFTGRRHFRH